MSFIEANKIVALLLTLGIVILSGEFLAELLVEGPELEEHAYQIAAVSEAEEMANTTPEAAPEISLASLMANADPAAGEKVVKKCTACHTLERGGANRIGPNLYGLLGRKIASHDGFKYSDALQAKSGEAWSYEGLDGFLASPKAWAPGTKMSFAGIKKPADRAALLAYLRQQSANPPPLPE